MLDVIYQRDFGGCILVTHAMKSPVTAKMFRSELNAHPAANAESQRVSKGGRRLPKKQTQKVVNDKIKNVKKSSPGAAGDDSRITRDDGRLAQLRMYNGWKACPSLAWTKH